MPKCGLLFAPFFCVADDHIFIFPVLPHSPRLLNPRCPSFLAQITRKRNKEKKNSLLLNPSSPFPTFLLFHLPGEWGLWIAPQGADWRFPTCSLKRYQAVASSRMGGRVRIWIYYLFLIWCMPFSTTPSLSLAPLFASVHGLILPIFRKRSKLGIEQRFFMPRCARYSQLKVPFLWMEMSSPLCPQPKCPPCSFCCHHLPSPRQWPIIRYWKWLTMGCFGNKLKHFSEVWLCI